jgi:hypothetical protein
MSLLAGRGFDSCRRSFCSSWLSGGGTGSNPVGHGEQPTGSGWTTPSRRCGTCGSAPTAPCRCCTRGAQEREVDTFVIYTDSETWARDVHPVQALRDTGRRSGWSRTASRSPIPQIRACVSRKRDPGRRLLVGQVGPADGEEIPWVRANAAAPPARRTVPELDPLQDASPCSELSVAASFGPSALGAAAMLASLDGFQGPMRVGMWESPSSLIARSSGRRELATVAVRLGVLVGVAAGSTVVVAVAAGVVVAAVRGAVVGSLGPVSSTTAAPAAAINAIAMVAITATLVRRPAGGNHVLVDAGGLPRRSGTQGGREVPGGQVSLVGVAGHAAVDHG